MCVLGLVGLFCLLFSSDKLNALVLQQPFPVPFENNFLAVKEIDEDFTSDALHCAK